MMKIYYIIVLNIFCLNCYSQSLFLFGSDQFLYELDVENCSLRQIKELSYYYTDISFYTDGNLYGIRSNGEVRRIDTLNSTEELIFTFFGGFYVGLTSSKDSIFYGAKSNGIIYIHNYFTGNSTNLGEVVLNIGGDATFRNGRFYVAESNSTSDRIILVDFDSIENNEVITGISTESGEGIFGLSSVISNCGVVNTYAILSNDIDETSIVYNVNFNTNLLEVICELDLSFLGSASKNEYYNSSVENEELALDSINISLPDCDSANGALEIFATGNEPLMYSMNNQELVEINFFENLDEQSINIQIVDQLGCTIDTIIDINCIGTSSSINFSNTNTVIQLSPNPTKGILYVETRETLSISKVNLYSISGKRQFININIEEKKIMLDLSILNSGVYFLIIDKSIYKIVKF